MDPATIASFLTASQQFQTGIALQAKMMQMSSEAGNTIVGMLQEAGDMMAQTAAQIAAPPQGMGGSVDISV